MKISIAHLRAAGLTEAQILRVVEIADAEQSEKRQEQNREAARSYRARLRQQNHADAAYAADAADGGLAFLSKEEKISPKEERKKELKKESRQKPKTALPPDWQPIGPQRDPTEANEFRDHARAKGYRYSDWDAAYRNFQRSAFNARNKSGASQPGLDEPGRVAMLEDFHRAQLNRRNGNVQGGGKGSEQAAEKPGADNAAKLRPDGSVVRKA